jgi:hypothetical protein
LIPTIALHIRRGDKITEASYIPALNYIDSIYEIIRKMYNDQYWNQQQIEQFVKQLSEANTKFQQKPISIIESTETIDAFLSLIPSPIYLFICSDEQNVFSEFQQLKPLWPFVSLIGAHSQTIFVHGFDEQKLRDQYELDSTIYSRQTYIRPTDWHDLLPVQKHTSILIAELEILRNAIYVCADTKSNMASFIQRIRCQPENTLIDVPRHT